MFIKARPQDWFKRSCLLFDKCQNQGVMLFNQVLFIIFIQSLIYKSDCCQIQDIFYKSFSTCDIS